MQTNEPLLGYGPQGLALETSPWQTKASIDAAMLYRGAIIAGWGAVETNIIEVAIRSSRHDAYLGIRETYPFKLKTRVAYLRDVLAAEGPLTPYAHLGCSILDRYVGAAGLRNMMAHARMTVLPGWGATFYGFEGKGDAITHYRERLTESRLAVLAQRSTRFARVVQSLMNRLDDIGIPTLEETFSPADA